MDNLNPKKFSGRLALQQRVMPDYRAPFFDALASACEGGLGVFSGQPRPHEMIVSAARLEVARHTPARNLHLLSGPFYVCWQAGFIPWLESWQPDALIVEANPRYPSTLPAVRWMHARGRPVIGWGLGAPPLAGPLSKLRGYFRYNLVRSLDAAVAYSQRGAEEYMRVGLPRERVFVAPNAVTPAPKHLPPSRPDRFSKRATVLFVGRLQARKRIDNLLRACASLPPERQPRLVIAGDGPEAANLRQLATSIYPLAEFPGDRRGTDLEALFVSADLFVLPGTGGLAVQQAMSYALPVIVGRGDGTQDDLVRPENGWRVPDDDWQALADRMNAALADPAALRRMGQASYRIVSGEINLEAMVAVFVRAADMVMGG